MPTSPSDVNLLFGILALQVNFVTRDALVKGMNAWVLEKHRPLGEILVEQGALRQDLHDVLDVMVRKHLEVHGNDAHKSLAALSSVDDIGDDLRKIGDADVQASIGHIAAQSQGDNSWQTNAPTAPALVRGIRYRRLRPHAKGGLGEVFVALDEELQREVALKEIQDAHADHGESRTRFLLEAEVTGKLEHPGVVPVYGLGRYDDGRPFYAMRFIKGDSLKEAIERFHGPAAPMDAGARVVALRELLGRFLDVCDAVAYAHGRGVLHRDLKPGNVMLGRYGETLVVDWGLAKVLARGESSSEIGDVPLMTSCAGGTAPTVAGKAVGTPQYMSPEQAAGRLDLLGPASDVYSLGATLYCLLTGEPPFSCPGEDGLGALLRKVEQGEFLSPRKIKPNVPSALEAICLKAMQRQPEDRYASVEALGRDVRQWLADEPVSAHREPWSKRLARWRRRHSTLVTAVASAVLVATATLTAATVLLSAAYSNERMARREADQAREEAEKSEGAAKCAETQERQAKQAEEAQRKQAEAVANLLESVFRSLDPQSEEKGGPDLKEQLTAQLDAAAANLEKDYAGQPAVRAKLRNTLGQTQRGLGNFDKADVLFRQATQEFQRIRGAHHPDTLITLANLAATYQDAGHTQEAVKLFEQVRPEMTKKLGLNHPNTRSMLNVLAHSYLEAARRQEAVALYELVWRQETKQLGPDDPSTLTTQNNLATAYQVSGQLHKAIELYEQLRPRQTKQFGPDHPSTLTLMSNLALAYLEVGRTKDAVELYEHVRQPMTKKLGPDHPSVLTMLNNLALSYHQAGNMQKAIELFEQVRGQMTKKLGPDHPTTLTTLQKLASAYRVVGRIQDAIQLYEYVREQRTKKLGPDHPYTLATLHNLAFCYKLAGRTDEAIELYEQVRQQRVKILGPAHQDTLITLTNLAITYQVAGRIEDAVKLYEQVWEQRVKTLGPDHADTLSALHNLAKANQAAGRIKEAIKSFEQLSDRRTRKLGPLHPDTLITLNHLAGAYSRTGQLHKSIPLFEESLRRLRCQVGETHPNTIQTAFELAKNYRDAGRLDEAFRVVVGWLPHSNKVLGADHPATRFGLSLLAVVNARDKHFARAAVDYRELLAICEKTQPETWTTFNTMSLLGDSLTKQKKYADAEPLLLRGYEAMRDRQDCIPVQIRQLRLQEALKRIVRLYEDWGKNDKADDWRKKLPLAAEKKPQP